MKLDITQKTINKMKMDAKEGRFEITDARARGLILRGGPSGVTWQHRKQHLGTSYRLILGSVDRWTVAEARAIADAASDHIQTFGTAVDDDWLMTYLVGAGKIEAPAAQEAASNAFPTFGQGREDYLAWVLEHRAVATAATYRGFLEMPGMRGLDDRRLPSITRDEIANIIQGVHAGGHESSAENLCRTFRPMWAWLGADGRRLTYGVDKSLLVGLKPPERRNAVVRDDDSDDPWAPGYVPEIAELGRIIAVARSGVMSPLIGLAVEFTCWTVQRRRAVVSARICDFIDRGDGTGLWQVRARKGGAKDRPHVIPLPAPAWDCVMRAYKAVTAKDRNARYLFPGARPRRAGGQITHMHPSTLTHNFADVPWCEASPHDVRRCMGTYGEALLGFSRAETGTIMDHSEAQRETDRITSRTAGTGTSDVTGVHYSLHDGTHRTWPVMKKWCEAVNIAATEAVRNLDPQELARGYGNPLYRSNVSARLIPVGTMSASEIATGKRHASVRLGRILGDRTPTDDEE